MCSALEGFGVSGERAWIRTDGLVWSFGPSSGGEIPLLSPDELKRETLARIGEDINRGEAIAAEAAEWLSGCYLEYEVVAAEAGAEGKLGVVAHIDQDSARDLSNVDDAAGLYVAFAIYETCWPLEEFRTATSR